MSLGLNKAVEDRTTAQVTWEEGDFEGEVSFRAVNPDSEADDQDVSTKTAPASALSVSYTYPEHYSGESVITGTDEAGNEHSITVAVQDGEVIQNMEE